VIELAVALPAGALQLTTVRISGRSPVSPTCGAVGNPMFTHDSAVEPDIEVDPGDPSHVVAAWIQDDGSAIATSTSTDAGKTWKPRVVPGLTRCTGGREPVVADPWLSFGFDHRLYLASGAGAVLRDPSDPEGFRIVSMQFVSRSGDAGRSWSRPSVTQRLNGVRWDKQTVIADPRSAARAYAVFCRRPTSSSQHGTLYVSRTVDGGRRWLPRQLIYRSPIPGVSACGNGGVVLHGHTVVLAFETFSTFSGSSARVMTSRSDDGGRTWRRAVQLATVAATVPGENGPEHFLAPTAPIVSLALVPTIAAERGGRVYVAWASLHPSGLSTVEIARSSDGGASWRRLRPITQTSAQPFGPRIAIASDGTIGATYYEAGRTSEPASWPANVIFAYSRDGAGSWRHTQIAGPTNLMTAEHPGGGLEIRIGDYFGLAASGNRFLAAYVLAKPQAAVPPQNVFVTRIGFARPRAGLGRVAGNPRGCSHSAGRAPSRLRPGVRLRLAGLYPCSAGSR
jgi:hypothetical protein